MKTRNLGGIIRHKKAWEKKAIHEGVRMICGLDTETKDGTAFVLGAWKDTGDSAIARIKRFEDFLKFIAAEGLEESDNFFYNAMYDFNALLKLLPILAIRAIAAENGVVVADPPCVLELIPQKALIIQYSGKTFRFYDISQFYGHSSLDKVSKKVLGEGKGKVEDVENLSPKKYDSDEEYRTMINRYLLKDCELCGRLAVALTMASREIGLNPKVFYSQASIAEQYFLENLPRKYANPPYPVESAALKCMAGGRFETFKRGFFPKVWVYDISSAYPYHMSRLPALDTGDWSHLKPGYIHEASRKATIGLYRAKVEGESIISPIRAEDKQLVYYPVGRRTYWLNRAELNVAKDYGYKVTILEGWEYHDRKTERPFESVKETYKKKEAVGKDDPRYMLYKILLNGLYGKLIQLNHNRAESPDFSKLPGWKSGRLFSAVYANEITANTRAQLLEAVKDQQEDIIAFATDSIMSEKPLKGLDVQDVLGSWKCEAKGVSAVVIGSGVYEIEGQKMKVRGFDKGVTLKEFGKGAKGTLIRSSKKKPQPLKQSCRTARYGGVPMMNVFQDFPKDLNLNFDRKRVWERPFNSFKDALRNRIESKPRRIKE